MDKKIHWIANGKKYGIVKCGNPNWLDNWFDGNINLVHKIDHIWRNEITLSPFFPIGHFKICMFSNDIHHKMIILDYRNCTRTYKCKQYLWKYFNWIWKQNLRWIFAMQGLWMESFVLRWSNYVYGKNDVSSIQKKFNHDNSK
jgi:hypothetical protein